MSATTVIRFAMFTTFNSSKVHISLRPNKPCDLQCDQSSIQTMALFRAAVNQT